MASLQIERPPSFVRLNLGDRWILSAQNRRLAVFIRGRDTYSTIIPNIRDKMVKGFSGEEVFSPLTNLALRKFDRQYYDSKICQIPKRTKNQAYF